MKSTRAKLFRAAAAASLAVALCLLPSCGGGGGGGGGAAPGDNIDRWNELTWDVDEWQ